MVTITVQPVNQQCLEGATAIFSVTSNSTHLPISYQWYENSNPIIGQTAATLTLAGVLKSNQGSYAVSINDADGNAVVSNTVTLVISCEKGMVPRLTADSGNPGGQVVVASVEAAGTGDAYRAFDGGIAAGIGGGQDGWSTTAGISNGFLQIFFPTPQLVRRYRIYPPGQTNCSPLTWTLQGSLDGSTWAIIDTRTNVTGWTTTYGKDFTTSASISYNYFKLLITSNQTGSGTLSISEWLLFNDALLNVAITFPSSGARETTGSSVNIQVVTTDSPSRTPQSVKYYANNTLIGTSSSNPFSFSWTNPTAGSYTLTAVLVNDLGEQAVSQATLTVWTSTPATLPPNVIITDPVQNASFPIQPAIVPISYMASSPGSTIQQIQIIVDSSVVYTTSGNFGSIAAGTYQWRGALTGLGSHVIAVKTTDANSLQTTSSTVTITFAAYANLVKYGTTAILSNTTAGLTELTGAVAYVWRFWDSASKTTVKGATEKTLNRATTPFTAAAFDQFGRFELTSYTGTDVAIDTLPTITKLILPESQEVLPYLVTLVVSAADSNSTAVFAWKDANGNLLAVSSPGTDGGTNFTYTHTVTAADEKIFLTVAQSSDWSNQFVLDFTLPGILNTPPVVSPLAAGLKPKAWVTVLDPVLCATIEPVAQLAGQPVIDGVQIPPVWVVGTPSKRLGPTRILVRNQPDQSTNGIYLTTTSQIIYNLVIGASGVVANTIQYNGTGLLSISATNMTGISALQVLNEHLIVGNLLVLSQSGGTIAIQFQITSVTSVSGGFAIGVIQIASSGSLVNGPNTAVDFGWTKTADVFEAGITIPVTNGTTNAGDYFAAVTDFDSQAAGSNPSVQFAKVNIDYSGSVAAKSLTYIESSSNDTVSLDCTASIDFLTTTGLQSFNGLNQTLLRAKIVTAGIAVGNYSITESVVDTSLVPGFNPTQTNVKATLTLSAS